MVRPLFEMFREPQRLPQQSGPTVVWLRYNFLLIWFAPWAGKTNLTLWLVTWGSKLALWYLFGTTHCFPHLNNVFHIINPLLTKLAGYWLHSFLTPSRSINKQKKNLADSQPSWPYAWSTTHTSTGTYKRKHPKLAIISLSIYWATKIAE